MTIRFDLTGSNGDGGMASPKEGRLFLHKVPTSMVGAL